MSRFKPGESGNPKGKPLGTKHASTKLRDVIADDLPGIIAALVEKAKGGDVGAANLLLSRCLPPLRSQSEAEDLAIEGTALSEIAEGVAAATLTGQLSPTVGSELMAMIGAQARVMETAELAERIVRLESALKTTKGNEK